ncbi:PREDICTED: putative uncharacterized protein C15orf56 homolog [Galeopterus variegatus]|uniref:Uncharacterized protein n=1 Tax=Galeopterus variegatus TaxID=482537 RepID=A0ABM0QUA8_GALVR|nr:PREDICTED: putative uncharacterized protein C15orf56 homolog [Galeopterus variegatus]
MAHCQGVASGRTQPTQSPGKVAEGCGRRAEEPLCPRGSPLPNSFPPTGRPRPRPPACAPHRPRSQRTDPTWSVR